MDIVKRLIQSVTRGFYDLRSMLVVDALLVHSTLSDDELQQLLSIQRKELRATCSKLKEDRLIEDHITKIEGPGQRPLSKTYYYIHYTEAVDAIKWKIHYIVNGLKEKMGSEAQAQGLICDNCKSRYQQIEVLDEYDMETDTFRCKQCGNTLRQDDSATENQANQERMGYLMGQIQPIIDDLRKIDDVIVPDNTFQTSFSQRIPVGSKEETRELPSMVLPTSKSRAGDANINGAAQFTVSITSEQETAELERRNQLEKERMAAENALPTWHSESTVGKSMFVGEGSGTATPTNGATSAGAVIKEEDEEAVVEQKVETEDKANEDALAAYYAQLAARQAEEDEEDEEEDDDDEEEEDEFEDVALPGAPASTGNALNNDDEDGDDDDD